MTCKMERILTPEGLVVLRVSDRIDAAHVEALRELTQKEQITKGGLTIDLTEVSLVSRKRSRLLRLRRRTESNLETVRLTYANGSLEGRSVELREWTTMQGQRMTSRALDRTHIRCAYPNLNSSNRGHELRESRI
jgi:hypothetical protein